MFFSGKKEVYLEICDRFEGYIRTGVYARGEKLPSVRTVAAELGVNPNTVARAFSLLEEKGLIRTIPKKGVYVSSVPYDPDADVRKALSAFRSAGMTYDSILNLLKEVYEIHDPH